MGLSSITTVGNLYLIFRNSKKFCAPPVFSDQFWRASATAVHCAQVVTVLAVWHPHYRWETSHVTNSNRTQSSRDCNWPVTALIQSRFSALIPRTRPTASYTISAKVSRQMLRLHLTATYSKRSCLICIIIPIAVKTMSENLYLSLGYFSELRKRQYH